MSYPGDSSLSPDVRHRILATFEQTLALAEQGNRQEALLGCDFVLRMDPHFTPARRLAERLHAGNGALAVDDLRSAAQAAAATLAPEEELFDLSQLGALDDELEAPVPGGGADLRSRLEALFAARRFEELIAAAEREVAAVIADPRLGALAEAARERLEAAPYVTRFLGKARQALAGGDAGEARRLLEKVRALDTTHPGLDALELEIAGAGQAPAAPPLASPAATAVAAAAAASLPLPLPGGLDDNFLKSGGGDVESERRIAQLLAEGQAAFDGGDPQAAIDSWSRIFLIDIDHQEAARRIELARKLKAENERRVEEVFHDGVASLETGDLAAARHHFERVLELQPSYLAAREYIEQIDAGTVPRPRVSTGTLPVAALAGAASPGLGGTAAEPMPLPGAEMPDLQDVGDLKEEILVPPEPGAGPTRERRATTAAVPAAGAAAPKRRFLLIGGAVLVLVLAAAGYFLLNRDTFFPNSQDETTAPTADLVQEALALKRAGDTAGALAKLRSVPPSHPTYERAQVLIGRWDQPAAPTAPAAPPSLAPEVEARRLEALTAARQSFSDGSYLAAVDHFEAAGKLARLEGPDEEQLAQARKRLEPISQQVAMFKEREWEYAIPPLWRLHEADPGNRDVSRLLIDSYYNLGVRDLQRFDPANAVKQLEEARKLDPGDPAIARQHQFAQTYLERPQDLLYRIYVKYLPFR